MQIVSNPVLEGQVTREKIKDTADVTEYSIDEIMIKASGARKTNTPGLLIKRATIDLSPVQTIYEALRSQAILDVRQRGPFASQSDFGINGGTYDQAQVLLNGINISDPQTGHHNLSLFIDPDVVDRFEISDGPSAIFSGSNPLTGLVNIVTGERRSEAIRFSLMTGQHSLNKISLLASDTTGKLSQSLSISRISSSGYTRNTDFRNTNAFYQARYDHKKGSSDFQAGFGSREFGANSFYSLKYPNQFEALTTGLLSIRYESKTRIKYSPAFYFRGNTDRFELKRNNDSIPFNYHKTYITGFIIKIGADNALGNTGLILNIRDEKIISNVLGNSRITPLRIPGSDGKYYTNTYSRLNTSLTATHSITIKSFSLTGGIMAYHNTDPGRSGLGFYPSLNATLDINDKTSLFISAGKTMRLPTFTDLFYTSPVQKGSRYLKAEEALTFNGGLRYNSSIINADISTFTRKGFDLLDWVKDPSPDSLIWRSMNHSEITFSGIESSITITPEESSPLRRMRSFSISYAYLGTDVKRSYLLSKYAFDYLNHKLTSSIDLLIFPEMHFFTTISWQDRNSVYQDINGIIRPYEPFWLCDMKVLKKIKACTLYAEASNIFNKQYYDYGGIIQPGRWFRVGIILELKRDKPRS
ncbi:MAG TPA: TonB-dependent receptor [Bacteroidales bacterium]|nr:TonB-dependent receptor [Bacteroidales bacterium]